MEVSQSSETLCRAGSQGLCRDEKAPHPWQACEVLQPGHSQQELGRPHLPHRSHTCPATACVNSALTQVKPAEGSSGIL